MANCEITLSTPVLENSTLDVVSKVQSLTDVALASESVYMRAKDTFKELMDSRNITEKEYASAASQFIGQLAAQTTQTVIMGALDWATKEKEMAYSLAATKQQIQQSIAAVEKTKADICLVEKEIDFKCTQQAVEIAGSIRDNGRVATWDTDGCTPLSLVDEGTKYEQALYIESQKYANLADSFRKSGVVTIGATSDGILKGISGDNAGYTDAQEEFARRQILSFEDSKRNHAANAMSQMIGQLLSIEEVPSAEYVSRWQNAIDYLITNTPSS
jgi:hypothetical protein